MWIFPCSSCRNIDNIPARHYQPLNHVSISEKWTIVSELLTGGFRRRFYGLKLYARKKVESRALKENQVKKHFFDSWECQRDVKVELLFNLLSLESRCKFKFAESSVVRFSFEVFMAFLSGNIAKVQTLSTLSFRIGFSKKSTFHFSLRQLSINHWNWKRL